jgi:SAM-dependent methyltransferase/GNAT superfamily N-acetyltransferase
LEETFSVSADTSVYTEGRKVTLSCEAEIIKAIKPEGKILDIGCCTGAMFEYFSGPSWQRYGVELSPSAAAYAAKTYEARVHTGTLQTAGFQDNYFDVITMIDMFYYVDDPQSELLNVARSIRPDGLLAIEIPGQAYMLSRSRGPLCLLSSGKWSRLTSDSSYLFWYTPRSLDRLLGKCGFKSTRWEVIASPSNFRGGSMLNLYDSVSRRAAKRWSYLLTWAPKYLCIAVPERSLPEKKVLSIAGPSGNKKLPVVSISDLSPADSVRPARKSDALEVAGLHHRFISDTSLLSEAHLDIGHINEYYRMIISRRNGSVHVACDGGRIIAYSSIVKGQSKIILSTIFAHPAPLIKYLRNPCTFRLSSLRYAISKFIHETVGKWPAGINEFKNAYELRSVAVEPEYRGLSVGSALLRASLEHARKNNFRPLIAWISESNLPSIRLFEKAGFRKIGEKMEAHENVCLYASFLVD